jgi:hypothetical protein
MSWHKLTPKVIDVLALLGHRCLGTHHLTVKFFEPRRFLKIILSKIYRVILDRTL